MKCPSCQHENREGAKFCEECAAALKRGCSHCGGELSPTAKFCDECGTPAAKTSSVVQPSPRRISDYTPTHLVERIRSQQVAMEARGALEGERKTITALFADLKGSTALLEGLDPEEARAIIDPALQIMMDSVHRYEGYVAQALGDGILALFGAPLAHEDHAQRAVFAALRMQDELRRYSDEVRLKQGSSLAMRVGLNTGEVVVRSIRKDDLHTDYVPVGHSINLAARMEQIAAPGSILITAYTQRLVAGYFALKALGEAAIKGVEKPLEVYEVTGVGQLRTRLQIAAQRGLTRFVGRQQELSQMQQALAHARAGRGQVIGIMGEPGMGKSRLVHEFKLSAAGFAVFEAYSASHGKASPYLPMTELLKGYFQIQLHDDDRTRREKVIGKILGLDRNLEDVLPYYFALLNIDDPASPLPQMDAQTRRRRTFEALKRATLRASLEQPLVLIFEDLHWIDSETQGFLDNLVESLASARILLLTNYRPEYRQEWGSKSYCTQLRLAPFGKIEAEEFLGILLGEPADVSMTGKLNGLRQWILQRTEGTPFFMEEIVQELFEQKVLQRESAGKVLFVAPALEVLHVPMTVQGVLAARIDRLAADEKQLLQQLAVIGREFPLSLARAVVGTDDDTLLPLLAALQGREFLYEQPAFPEVEFIFKHALTQEVAYNSLLQERRKAIHEKAAQAIECAYQSEIEDHYADLAHHYSRSGNAEKAITYLRLAGAQASQRAQSSEAVNYFSSALLLLRSKPDRVERAREELALQMELAGQLMTAKSIAAPEVGAVLLEAHQLSEQVGTPFEQCLVLIGLRLLYVTRGDNRRAMELAKRLLDTALSIDAPELVCHGHVAMSLSKILEGNPRQGHAHAAAGLTLYDPQRDRNQTSRFGFDAAVACYNFDSIALWIAGYPDQARYQIAQSLVLVEQLGYPFMTGFALIYQSQLCVLSRDTEVGEQCSGAAVALADEFGFPDWFAIGTVLRRAVLTQSGVAGESAKIRDGISNAKNLGVEVWAAVMLAYLAEALTFEADFAAAEAALGEAMATAERNHERYYDAELYRLRGELILRQHPAPASVETKRAEGDFEHALQIAQQQAAKSWELRATMSLAKLWMQQGRSLEAHARLAAVYAWFTEGFATKDLLEANALLEALTTAGFVES